MLSITRSRCTEKLIHLDGVPFSFTDYPFLRQPYDDCHREVLLKAGRQVAKSTTLHNILISEMVSIPYFRSLYVSPTIQQTRRFSNQRFAPTVKDSPLIMELFMDQSVVKNVGEKSFTNGSFINFSHAFADAQTIRGISSDRLCVDEVQDILWDTVPVIKETQAASKYKWVMYAGTPKTYDNTIECLWKGSTQCEWVTRCAACNHHNIPSFKNIGKLSYVCSKCDKPLNVGIGEWRAVDPSAYRLGFRIPQIIRPNLDWVDLRNKIDSGEYSEGRIRNEILGDPYDIGVKPITMSDLMACCRDYMPSDRKLSELGVARVFAGLDWAVTSGTTVFTAGGMDSDGKFKVLYARKWNSVDPRAIIDEVVGLCNTLNVEVIGCDRGAGHTNNLILSDKLQWTKSVEFVYMPKLNAGRKWDKGTQGFFLDRTIALDATINHIKNQKILFPKYDSFGATYFPDIVCVFMEYNDYLKKVEYKHPIEKPDDFFHALTYALFAYQINTKYDT